MGRPCKTMPGTYDSERNGKDKTLRKQALLNRARTATGDSRTWTEYFTEKRSTVVSTVTPGIQHVALHTFAKVSVFTVTWAAGLFTGPPGWIATIIGGGLSVWSMLSKDVQEKLGDYGAGVIDDWLKAGGESGGQYLYGRMTSSTSTPSVSPTTSGTSTEKINIETEAAALCNAVGMLAALMAKSEELSAAPTVYCDDAYAQARVIKRIDDEIASVKSKVDSLKVKLDNLKLFVDGAVTTDINLRKQQVDAQVEAVVKAAGAPHFVDTYLSYITSPNPLYRLSHCSKANCFGPGQTGLD